MGYKLRRGSDNLIIDYIPTIPNKSDWHITEESELTTRGTNICNFITFGVEEKFYLTNGNYIQITINELQQNISYSYYISYVDVIKGLQPGDYSSFNTRSLDPPFFSILTFYPTSNYDLNPQMGYLHSSAFENNLYIGYGIDTTTFLLTDFFEGVDNPAFPGNSSGTGGGSGTFDNTSDPIDFPNLPTLTAVNSGFVTLFTPTQAQLKSINDYMWSSAFDISTLKKLFANPMDCIIGLGIVPVSVPSTSAVTLKVGGVSTGISISLADSQFITFNCGSINVQEYWGNMLDYSPHTKISIYLPYIGVRALKTDDIMNKSIQLKYYFDLLSGTMTAMLKCGDSVLYTESGSCLTQIPISGTDYSNLINSYLNLAKNVVASTATGNVAGTINATADCISSMKPNLQRGGTVSGSTGLIAPQQPYLIIERPRQSLPKKYNEISGYPCNITYKLSDLTGYTEVEEIHLENIPCTETELAEIENLLKEGVIL